MTDFEKGGIKAIQTIIDYINSEIVTISTSNPKSNTPRQITNGGKLLALNKLLNKCISIKNRIKKRSENH